MGKTDDATPLDRLGPALRRLRKKRDMKQYEVADAAGVTKAMLSAYETGKRRPSIRTLESLLEAMRASLGDLHMALVAEQREARAAAAFPAAGGGGDELGEATTAYDARYDGGRRDTGSWGYGPGVDVYQALGIDEPLLPPVERALDEMLRGFLKILRFMHERMVRGEVPGWHRSPYDS
ncbi:MAG TPA: helix-turn-helix transcriptional regulator [Thermoanaerobaculia bacterium]|nr:helix-turn-helix transcriptional regulator [Thermoanaerobaculia bacterium]